MNKSTNTFFRLFITATVLVVGFIVHTTPADARSKHYSPVTPSYAYNNYTYQAQPSVTFSPTGYITTTPVTNNQYGANSLNYGYSYPATSQPSYYSQNYLNQNITTNINSNNTYSPYQTYSPYSVYPTTSQYYPTPYPTANYNTYSPVTYPVTPTPIYTDPNNYQYQQTYTDPNAYTNYNANTNTDTNVSNNQTGYNNTF